jgi:hypothetical protein
MGDLSGDRLRVLPCPQGQNTVMWAGQSYSAPQWEAMQARWELQYPKLEHHPSETPAHRTAQTGAPEILDHCWAQLARLPATLFGGGDAHRMHPEHRKCLDIFRVDMFGNVVARDAEDGAVCALDIDHVLPWCRGGRSVAANFAAMYASALLLGAASSWVPRLQCRACSQSCNNAISGHSTPVHSSVCILLCKVLGREPLRQAHAPPAGGERPRVLPRLWPLRRRPRRCRRVPGRRRLIHQRPQGHVEVGR